MLHLQKNLPLWDLQMDLDMDQRLVLLVVLLKQGMNQPRRLLGLHLSMDMDP